MAKRDYSLLGPNGKHAVEIGLAAADWYHTDVPRNDMKALMARSDQPCRGKEADHQWPLRSSGRHKRSPCPPGRKSRHREETISGR